MIDWPSMRATITCCQCLLLLSVSVEIASGVTTVFRVTFLGYVQGGSDEKNFSAFVLVDGMFDGEPVAWRASRLPAECGGTRNRNFFDATEFPAVKRKDLSSGTRMLQVLLPEEPYPWNDNTPLFLCSTSKTRGQETEWLASGPSSMFTLPQMINDYILNEAIHKAPPEGNGMSRSQRSAKAEHHSTLTSGQDNITVTSSEQTSNLYTRIVSIQLAYIGKYVSYGDNGVINARQGFDVPLYIYGVGLSNDSEVKLTSSVGGVGLPCKSHGLHVQTMSFPLEVNDDGTFGNLLIPAGTLQTFEGNDLLYLCLRPGKTSSFLHQGTFKSLQIKVYDLLLPVWLMVIFIVVLLCLSGLFSGLNLGLMALDKTELKIVQNTGSEKEKRYANKIAPIRSHGNFLLCALLLGNVLVNNTMTIILDSLTSGIVAVIGSTIAIVVFGEIIPQAICSRHGLAVGAHTIWLTKFFMLITFPLAFPISKILDKILGAEIGTVYNKKRLIELLRVTRDKNDLEKEEVDIVTGALAYKEKTVRSCMTNLSDVYMLNIKTTLDFETISEIREQGYSRIPVFEDERTNIVYVLFVKDLMFIDPDDNTPLAMVCEYYKNDVNFVFHDTPLNIMFNEFKSGEKGHMAFVQDVNDSGCGDPFYETIGIITIEDIIEEIIQQEIIDETDVVVDHRTKKRRLKNGKLFSEFPVFHEHDRKVNVSPQLTMAVFQYMVTSIEPFKAVHMSELVLKRLLTMDIFREVKLKKNQTNEEDLIIIEKGKPIDCFFLIIEGRVQAKIGREELLFESGPFSFYGLQVLTQVLDSPPSPVMAPKVTTPCSMLGPLTDVANGAIKVGGLKKTSTQLSFEVPHVLNRRASSLTGTAVHDGSAGGLSGQNSAILSLNFPPFIPDYTVKAVTDVMYMRIKRTTYLRALKATYMSKKPSPCEVELEKYLERVNEDENILVTTPKMSPDKPKNIFERLPSFASGYVTPTMSLRSGQDQVGSQSRHGGLNNSFHNFTIDKDRTEEGKVDEEDENLDEDESVFWNNESRQGDNTSSPLLKLTEDTPKKDINSKSSIVEANSSVSPGALVISLLGSHETKFSPTISSNCSTSSQSKNRSSIEI